MKSQRVIEQQLKHLKMKLDKALLKRDQATVWEDLTNLQHNVDEICEKIKLLEWVLDK